MICHVRYVSHFISHKEYFTICLFFNTFTSTCISTWTQISHIYTVCNQLEHAHTCTHLTYTYFHRTYTYLHHTHRGSHASQASERCPWLHRQERQRDQCGQEGTCAVRTRDPSKRGMTSSNIVWCMLWLVWLWYKNRDNFCLRLFKIWLFTYIYLSFPISSHSPSIPSHTWHHSHTHTNTHTHTNKHHTHHTLYRCSLTLELKKIARLRKRFSWVTSCTRCLCVLLDDWKKTTEITSERKGNYNYYHSL